MSKKILFTLSLGTAHPQHHLLSGMNAQQRAKVALLFEQRIKETDYPNITLRITASEHRETVPELRDDWNLDPKSSKQSQQLDRAMMIFALTWQAVDALKSIAGEEA